MDTEEEQKAKVVAWIERELGPIIRIERQGRWRPAWMIDVKAANGGVTELFVRGARGGGWPAMPLSYEAQAQEVLEAQGVRVPHVFGFIEEVPAIVMSRMPGRPNMAHAASDAARESLREQLADQMLRIHQVDPALIAAKGAPYPDDPRELTLSYYRQMEALYLRRDRLPAPDMEFARRWIDRNAPPCEEGAAVVTVDAGQFIFEGDRLTSMLDFELVTVGDRHVDFAALTSRNRFERIGDLEAFYELYHARGGMKLDRRRIQFHRVSFCMATPLQIAHELAHPEWAPEYFEYVKWQILSMSDVLIEIARCMGVTLPGYPSPEPTPTPSGFLLQSLVRVVEQLSSASDAYSKFRQFNLTNALKHLAKYEAGRSDYEPQYLDDVEGLTGRRPRNEWEGDVALQDFIKTAPPELDLTLLEVLHKRVSFYRNVMNAYHDRTNPLPAF